MSRGIENLIGIVAPEILVVAVETSQRLTELGIPHALIGGIAVGFHGHPRATKDVDYLVGNEAFKSLQPILVYREELKELVKTGVVDLVGIPMDYPEISENLSLSMEGEIPVLPVEALILMKLSAARPQDIADVSSLLTAGADINNVINYLRKNAPGLVEKFAEIIQ